MITNNLLQANHGVLQQVHLARGVLSVARVELHDALGLLVGSDINVEGGSNNIPGDRLSARRSGEGSGVPLRG